MPLYWFSTLVKVERHFRSNFWGSLKLLAPLLFFSRKFQGQWERNRRCPKASTMGKWQILYLRNQIQIEIGLVLLVRTDTCDDTSQPWSILSVIIAFLTCANADAPMLVRTSSLQSHSVPRGSLGKHLWEEVCISIRNINTGCSICLRTLVGLTFTLGVPLSARFCMGRWNFGRHGWAIGQDGEISQI